MITAKRNMNARGLCNSETDQSFVPGLAEILFSEGNFSNW